MGETLKRLRTERGLTQAALSERSGVSQPVICDIENGVALKPRMETIVKLCTALGVKIEDFIGA